MRRFNYRHLPQKLFNGKVGNVNVKLYEDRGKLSSIRKMHPELLDALTERAHLDNVCASSNIEGLYLKQSRMRKLLDGASPLNETEAQAIGYSNALHMIEEHTAEKPLQASTILALYETLYAHRNLGRKSRYRKKDYMYVQVDGHPQAVPVSPVPAFETPLVLGGACDSLLEAFDADACSPLILLAVFTVDLLCIRPFDEGNGRIARLFTNLLLMKAGFDIGRYASVDAIIERKPMDYYNALNACVDGWDHAANDYEPYALYWLNTLHQAYQELFDEIELNLCSGNSKAERVRIFVAQSPDPVTKRQLRDAFPDISEATIENALAQMVKAFEAEKLGAGRSTSYLWREKRPGC